VKPSVNRVLALKPLTVFVNHKTGMLPFNTVLVQETKHFPNYSKGLVFGPALFFASLRRSVILDAELAQGM
jgi:hypothetical protein